MSSNDSPAYATAASVAGLASEVEGVRRALQRLRAVPAQVDDLTRVVADLAAELNARPGRARGGAASWLALPTDVEIAHAVLTDLVEWLAGVYLRYPDAVAGLPDCWLWHPDVVEELLTLMTLWSAAYRAEDATATAAGDWHDRYRPGVVARITRLAGTCSVENHHPRAGGRTAPVVPLAEALVPIAAWWAQHRTDAPPTPAGEPGPPLGNGHRPGAGEPR